MPQFAREVEGAVNALSTRPPGYVDENEFIDASRLVYDGVREIRRAVLMNRVWGHLPGFLSLLVLTLYSDRCLVKWQAVSLPLL